MSNLASKLLGSFPRQSFIILGPAKSPGVATVRGAGSPRDWTINKGYGLSGATVVYTGTNLAKFDVEIKLWEPEHFLQWESFSKVLTPPKNRVGLALGIIHPLLNAPPLGITEVVVEDVSQFEQSDTGLWTCTIKFLQYRKPLPALARPQAAYPPDETPNVEPQNPNQKHIAEQLKQIALKGG